MQTRNFLWYIHPNLVIMGNNFFFFLLSKLLHASLHINLLVFLSMHIVSCRGITVWLYSILFQINHSVFSTHILQILCVPAIHPPFFSCMFHIGWRELLPALVYTKSFLSCCILASLINHAIFSVRMSQILCYIHLLCMHSS